MNFKDIKKTEFNPRSMTKEARAGLKASIDAFGDISGIVWNKRSGQLVGGNHRWEELTHKFKKKNLSFEKIENTDLYLIMASGEFTGYTLREVDWDEDTSKAANITANNQNIAGHFTSELDHLLKGLEDFELFDDLKLGSLYINIDVPVGKDDIKDNFFDEDDDFDLKEDLSGFAQEAETVEDKPTRSERAEVSIFLEGDIDLLVLEQELKDVLIKKYKIQLIKVST